MRILALGDVVGTKTVDYFGQRLWSFRSQHKIDFVIANGENATDSHGVTAKDAQALLDTGVDVVTLGNHAFGMRDIYTLLDNHTGIIRPANYPPEAPGSGYTLRNVDGWRLLCINVCGRVFMEPLANPFDVVDRILEREAGRYDLAIMDIHAEVTSEKLALAHYFDGRVQVIFGTHTHVPTADTTVLPKGSGYVTDLGMCGPANGILGTDKDTVIYKLRTSMPTRFHVADGEICVGGVLFDLDGTRVKDVRRVSF